MKKNDDQPIAITTVLKKQYGPRANIIFGIAMITTLIAVAGISFESSNWWFLGIFTILQAISALAYLFTEKIEALQGEHVAYTFVFAYLSFLIIVLFYGPESDSATIFSVIFVLVTYFPVIFFRFIEILFVVTVVRPNLSANISFNSSVVRPRFPFVFLEI